MYVAVKGGEEVIDNAHRLLACKRRSDTALSELSMKQVCQQIPLVVSRMMIEGSLYGEQLAALTIRQAAGDSMEAISPSCAYRITLPRFVASLPLDTTGICLQRRISVIYKDLPGGQLLGPAFDYIHRLLDFSLLVEGDYPDPEVGRGTSLEPCPRVPDLLGWEGLVTPEYELPGVVLDTTCGPLDSPVGCAQRLQALARGDGGSLFVLGYSTQRSYGRNHPFAGKIRIGACEVWLESEELDLVVLASEIEVIECETVNQSVGLREELSQFIRDYGLVFGYTKRKAMGMALVDRALRTGEYDEEVVSPA